MSTSYRPLPTEIAPASPPPTYSPPPGTDPSTKSLQNLELSSPSSSPPPSTRRPRSDTLTGFEFGRSLDIPLSLSEEETARNAAGGGGAGGEKHVGLVNGVALVVGLQVGSGIFSSPGVVLASVGSPGAALAVWLVSGLLAWSGASSFAELGSAIPLNGGAQAYLAYAYGPLVSYLFSWTAVSLLKPGSAAIISLIFGEYITKLLYNATTPSSASSSPLSTIEIPDWPHKLLATLAVLIISFVNALSNRGGTGLQVVITVVKVASLLFVIVLGVVSLIRGGGGVLAAGGLFEGSSTNAGSYAIALYSGLWSFDGFDQSNFVAGEMVNVNRDLPRVIHSSMALVTTLFTLANVAYFIVLSKDVIASSNTVALDFGSAMFGPIGGIIFALLVAISCFGALNGSFYTTARLIRVLALEGSLPSTFGKLNAIRNTPDHALALQAVMTVGFILLGGGFRTLVNLFSVANWLFYLLTVLGLIILRFKEPHLERPYRTFLVTPIIFCIVALFLLLMPIVAAPGEALAAFAFIALGIPLFYLTSSSRASSSTSAGPSSQLSVKDRILDVWDATRGFFTGSDGTRESGGRFVRSGARGSEIVEMVSPGESGERREDFR